MTTGPVKRICGRCGRHGYPAAHFPDSYLCGTCLHAALDTRGACPGCAAIRVLPGRRPADQAPICRDCAGISRHFTCLRCDYEVRCPTVPGQGSNRIRIRKGTGSGAGKSETILS